MRLENSPAGCFQQKAVSRVLKCRAFRSASHPYARRSRSRRRIPSGVPKTSGNLCCLRLFIITAHRKGFEQGGRMRSIRKKTARWAVFAAVGNERSEAIAAAAAENPFRRTKNTRVTLVALVFLWIRIGASSLDLWNCRI